MSTARTIIKRAMRKAGILTTGQEPTADEANDALDSLNDLLASLFNENLIVYGRSVESFTLTASQASYTIGSGGDFNTTRPNAIASAYVRIGNIDYPLEPYMDTLYDENTALKTLSTIPNSYVYENTYPLGRFTLYPVPASGWTLYLRLEKPVTELTLDSTVSMPPGWNQFLIYKLATILAPEYGQQIDPNVVLIANQSKEALELQVAKARTIDAIPSGLPKFNIYTGQGY